MPIASVDGTQRDLNATYWAKQCKRLPFELLAVAVTMATEQGKGIDSASGRVTDYYRPSSGDLSPAAFCEMLVSNVRVPSRSI